jgi:hypothetical protein
MAQFYFGWGTAFSFILLLFQEAVVHAESHFCRDKGFIVDVWEENGCVSVVSFPSKIVLIL